MTDAELLRTVLPQLHTAVIAEQLTWNDNIGAWFLYGPERAQRISPGQAVTYAIGSIVEYMFQRLIAVNPSSIRSDSPSPLGQLITDLKRAGKLPPKGGAA